MPLTPPFVLVDRYEITAEIGRGGHAVVYHAHDRVLDREVAVKLLREDVLSSDTLARFHQEVQVTAQLEHAHILHVYDTGAFEGRPYIVMELASGRTLADRLGREGQLPIVDALQIARDVGLALAHAHSHGVVHRDVKPENILLGAGGAILADFGIARITSEDVMRHITSTGTTVGTVQYMSPEQLCAEPKIDARSDQYSLACVLYEMLAGVRPHNAATFEGLRLLRMTGQCVPARAHRPSVPENVDDAIAVALSPLAADRFRTMEELLAAIGVSASGEFATSGSASAARRSGGYGAIDVHGTASERARHGGQVGASNGVPGAPSAQSSPSSEAPAVVSRPTWRKLVLPAAGVGALAIAGVFASKQVRSGSSEGTLADGTVAVMLRSGAGRGSDTASLSGRYALALRSELDLWSGLRVVEKLPPRDTTAVAIESSVGVIGDSVRVRVEVTRSGSAEPRRLDVLVDQNSASTPAPIVASLVRQALVARANGALTSAETPGIDAIPVRSFAVLRAYVGGFAALRAGQLDSAAALFREAASASGKPFAQAELWAAQSDAWSNPRRTDKWHVNVDNAVRAGTLHGLDSLLANALGALGRANFPAACESYRAATTTAPGSFVAWYGLGECQRLDSVVIVDSRGARFRSSDWGALLAYRMSIRHAPTSEWLAPLYPAMFRMTYAETNRVRNGRADDADRTPYSAMPSLSGDTIALIPGPRSAFATTPPPVTWIPATRRGLAVALELTSAWTDRWPASGAAWFHRALALELAGRLGPNPEGQSAQDALARATHGASNALLAAQIQVVRARVALRLGDMKTAGRIAREATREPYPSLQAARVTLAPLAALIADVRAAERLAIPDTERVTEIPSAVSDSVAAFRLRAVMGECDELAKQAAGLEALFAAKFTPQELVSRRVALLQPAYRDAVPCLTPKVLAPFAPSIELDRIFSALNAGNRDVANRMLREIRASRKGATIGSITWDHLYPEAWATLQAGDTVTAREELGRALTDVSNMSVFTLSQIAQASGLRRGLELLAALTPPDAKNSQLRLLASRYGELVAAGPSKK